MKALDLVLNKLASALAQRVTAATVTVGDVSDQGRKGRMEAADLVKGFAKWVAIANSRNAAAVASTPIRIMRRQSALESAFDSRRLKGWEITRLRATAGQYAAKAIDMSEDLEEITDPDHPMIALIQSVNKHMNHYDLLEGCESSLGLMGDAYWVPVPGPNGWPVEIWPLAADYVEVVPDEQMFIRGYRYGRDPKEMEYFDAEQVIHFKRPNPTG
ncbi:MAG: phage portal protein, partial [Actinobacteria bacterium]